jgi:branched-chain amino acid transport system permease protein
VLEWFSANQFFIDNTLITTVLVMSFFVALQAGVFSLASVGLMAVGGYMTAVLTTTYQVPVVEGIFAGALAGGVMAGIFGLAVARLSGIYLALATFALGQSAIVIIGELKITNGQQGILGIPVLYTTAWTVGGLLIAAAVFEVIRRSSHGRAFRAVRVDEVVAKSIGINAGAYRLVALILSGLLAGFAGALNAHEVGVISPDQYNFGVLVLGLTYAMVGGVEHWAGPMLASAALGIFREQARGVGTDIEDAAYGVLLVVLIFLAPRGLGDRRVVRGLARLSSLVRSRLRRPGSRPPPATPLATDSSSNERAIAGPSVRASGAERKT